MTPHDKCPAIVHTSSSTYLYCSPYMREKSSTMPSPIRSPETFYIKASTPHVPNSPLPVLIYRSALPDNPTPESTCSTIEPNDWLMGGVFKHYGAHHFHSVTHECYAVSKGCSRLLLGRGPLDEELEDDLVVDLKEGDAIVLPAGVAHCSMWDIHTTGSRPGQELTSLVSGLESIHDYEYVGLYPKVRKSALFALLSGFY